MERKSASKKTAAAKPAPKKTALKATIKKTPPKAATAPSPELEVKEQGPKREFVKALGRRKEATAEIRLFPAGAGEITVNKKPLSSYFPQFELREAILSPIRLAGREGKIDASARLRGGGSRGQAEAMRLGIARALVKLDEQLRRSMKKSGFLTRDARVKERKKYGLKKARRAPQWAKR
ncbi:30S ribosomal protein S9 [Patescibacteria group bacterium]|nr:MAG: 30S ribosomal protein S9 [Patescibacteria group bacterium]